MYGDPTGRTCNEILGTIDAQRGVSGTDFHMHPSGTQSRVLDRWWLRSGVTAAGKEEGFWTGVGKRKRGDARTGDGSDVASRWARRLRAPAAAGFWLDGVRVRCEGPE